MVTVILTYPVLLIIPFIKEGLHFVANESFFINNGGKLKWLWANLICGYIFSGISYNYTKK